MRYSGIVVCAIFNCVIGMFSGLSAFATTLTEQSILENSELGTEVGEFETEGVRDGETVEYRIVGGEGNACFEIQGTKLVAVFSFDWEVSTSYHLTVETIRSGGDSDESNFVITIKDVEGPLDTNGVAGERVAARYPAVNVGDYVIFNRTAGNNVIIDDGELPQLGPQSKLLIKGDVYKKIRLNGVVGESIENRLPVTNFLGQVKVEELNMVGGSYWRLTGQYDAVKGLGDRRYLGCDSAESGVDFGFSHGRYGIHCTNGWENESYMLLSIKGAATGFEVDHIEMSDGGFAGIAVKNDNSSKLMENIHIHHLYVHDVGSEGIYLGSTQRDPQHQFRNLLIENCVFLRTGSEALQVGQLMENCVIRNNVMWGAFDWLSPFDRWQDNAVQFYTRAGGATFSDNIVMGGAGSQLSIYQKNKASLRPNGLPTTISNNLIWGTRSSEAAYIGADTDGKTHYRIVDNFWGATDFDYNKVYPSRRQSSWIGRGGIGYGLHLEGNRFDLTRADYYDGGAANFLEKDNVQGEVLPPQFLNLIGASLETTYLNWTRWTEAIGEAAAFPSEGTNKGDLVVFQPGDVVQYPMAGGTAFYICLEEAKSKDPRGEEGGFYWKRLSWEHGGETYYTPPDDVRMEEGGLYYDRGIGVMDRDPRGKGWLHDSGKEEDEVSPESQIDEDIDHDSQVNFKKEGDVIDLRKTDKKLLDLKEIKETWLFRFEPDFEEGLV